MAADLRGCAQSCVKFTQFHLGSQNKEAQLKMWSLSDIGDDLKEELLEKLSRRLKPGKVPSSWAENGTFSFWDDDDGIQYFVLKQKEAGPSGVYACVQAFIMRHLRQVQASMSHAEDRFDVRRNALTASLVEMLWKARFEENDGVKVIIGDRSGPAHSLAGEKWFSVTLASPERAKEIMRDNFDQITRGGVLLFVCSMLLTRGIRNMTTDALLYDSFDCTTNLVNLLLVGKENKFTFSGDAPGFEDKPVIGFLTGPRLAPIPIEFKNPAMPIWVLLVNNHFICVYSLEEDCPNSDTRIKTLYAFRGMMGHVYTRYEIKVSEDPGECDTPQSTDAGSFVDALKMKWGANLEVLSEEVFKVSDEYEGNKYRDES